MSVQEFEETTKSIVSTLAEEQYYNIYVRPTHATIILIGQKSRIRFSGPGTNNHLSAT